MIKALVFDMDGLLFDSERIVQMAWNIAGKKLGFEKMGEHIYHTIGFNLKSRNEYFHKALGLQFSNEEFTKEARAAFQRLAEESGVSLKPGVIELLEYAKARDYKMAVATSSREEYATKLLKEGDIYPYFDGFVFGDMVQHSKPDPEIYIRACELIGVSPQNAMALEDSPTGIKAAYAAGMSPVMIPDLVEPDEIILGLLYGKLNTLLEVIPMLECAGIKK